MSRPDRWKRDRYWAGGAALISSTGAAVAGLVASDVRVVEGFALFLTGVLFGAAVMFLAAVWAE